MFFQNWLCPRKFSIWVNFRWRIGFFGDPCFIGPRPLTRSWFRFWFWWQFKGDFFDRLVSLFFFAQFDSWFYFCIFWISRSFLIIWTEMDRLQPTRTAWTHRLWAKGHFFLTYERLVMAVELTKIFKKVGTYWIYSELPKHWDSFR